MRRTPRWIRTHHLFYGLLVAALLLVFLSGLVSLWSTREVQRAASWSQHSERVMTQAHRVLGVLGNTESFGLRWMLSMELDYFARYRESMKVLDDEIAALRTAVGDSSGQSEKAVRLAALVAERRVWNDETIRLMLAAPTRTAALDVPPQRVATGTGGRLAQAIRAEIDGMLLAESAVRQQRERSMRESLSRASMTIIAANALAMLVGMIGFLSTWQSRKGWIRERELAWQKERAEAASQQKSLFLATMSHEIRTPMNAIFGFSQLLSRQVKDPKAVEYVRAIRSSGQSLLALINDLLDLSKIEAGRMELHLVPTDVQELLESTLTVFADAAADKGLRLHSEIDPVLPRAVLIDPHRFRQVLMNLVSNAVKYTREGSVRVSLRSQQVGSDRVALEIGVADTGIGIEPEHLERIWEPFHRTETAEISRIEGAGLGLSIVRRLVELMDGRISVRSTVGEGSTFLVRFGSLPVARRSIETAARTQEVDFSTLRASRVLVVDDIELNRNLLRAYLADSGHELAFAEDGEQAVQMASSWQPDVVLMDIRMPKLDGRQAAQIIRRHRVVSPPLIIAVTASSMTGEEASPRQIFDAYLRKPVGAQELHDCLQVLLPKREREREAEVDAGDAVSAAVSAPEPPTADGTSAAAAPSPGAIAAVAEVLAVQWPKARASMRSSEVAGVLDQLRVLLPACSESAWDRLLDNAVESMAQFRVEEVEDRLNALQKSVAQRIRAMERP